MKKTKEQRRVIEQILKDATEQGERTVYEISAYCGDAETRSTYYRALRGDASDEVQIVVFMACNAPASHFSTYCSACGIGLSPDFAYSRIILDYINDHDSAYDIDELEEYLHEANQPSLIRKRAA